MQEEQLEKDDMNDSQYRYKTEHLSMDTRLSQPSLNDSERSVDKKEWILFEKHLRQKRHIKKEKWEIDSS